MGWMKEITWNKCKTKIKLENNYYQMICTQKLFSQSKEKNSLRKSFEVDLNFLLSSFDDYRHVIFSIPV